MATDMQNHKSIVDALASRCDQLAAQQAPVTGPLDSSANSCSSPTCASPVGGARRGSSMADAPSLLVILLCCG